MQTDQSFLSAYRIMPKSTTYMCRMIKALASAYHTHTVEESLHGIAVCSRVPFLLTETQLLQVCFCQGPLIVWGFFSCHFERSTPSALKIIFASSCLLDAVHKVPSEKTSCLKGKNLIPVGAYSLRVDLFSEG